MNASTVTDEPDKKELTKLNKDNPLSLVEEDGIIKYPPLSAMPSKLGDKLRPISYVLTALRAETKYVLRKSTRELKNLFRLFDLIMIFLILGIGLVAFFIISVYGLPFVLSILPESLVGNPNDTIWGEQICKFFENGEITYSGANCDLPNSEKTSGWPLSSGYVEGTSQPKFTGLSTYILNLWTSDTTLRIMVGVIAGLGVVFRLLFKSEIDKFRDKVTPRKDVTYVFGSTIYAEKFLTLLTHTFASADEAALISDAKYLWVERIAGLLDTYVSEKTDNKTVDEFAKPNLYEIIGFKNAKRVFILTESIERNQNILTNIRKIRPDVPIFILSQYTPEYLKGELIKDDHLFIIDDTAITREGLVKSLSLDINFPLCSEVNVPRNYVGKSPLYFNEEVPGLEILAVKRPHLDEEGWDLLPPEDVNLQRTDRILIHIESDFKMKEANRIITELPVRHLADLGQLKYNKTGNSYVTGKVTEIPGRKLLIEPMGSRKSYQRRIVISGSFLAIFLGIAIGRNWISFLAQLPFGLTIELTLILIGIVGIYVFRTMFPILERGIIELDKFEKTYTKKTKSFKRGKDVVIDISNSKGLILVIVDRKKGNKQFRHYHLVNEVGEKTLLYSILWKKNEKNEKKNLYLNRFENRLESLTNLKMQTTHQESYEMVIIEEDDDDDEDFEEILESKMNTNAPIIPNEQTKIDGQTPADGSIEPKIDNNSSENLKEGDKR